MHINSTALFLLAIGSGQAMGQNPAAPASAGAMAQVITRAGSLASNQGPADYFTGEVRVDPLFAPAGATPYAGAYVTFAKGARSAWHTPPAGQRLIITAGTGWTRVWGGKVTELHVGDVIWCPPGVKHWHGASASSSMTHLALTGTVDGKNVEWMEKAGDSEYRYQP